MIGRFIDHEGKQTNEPSVRFGNISINPSPIQQPNGFKTDSYCLDLHSRSGYSGSPVFVYRTPGFDLESQDNTNGRPILTGGGPNFIELLGIHWGQFPELWEIYGKNLKENSEKMSLIVEGNYIRGVSGMTCALPAWVINEVLNIFELRKLRAVKEQSAQVDCSLFY